MTAEPLDISVPTADGLTLHALHWPTPSPRGALVIAHGLGEHAGCYRHVAEALGPRRNLHILALDFRGHGHSPGRRGVVRHYDDLLADLEGARAWLTREYPGLPQFLLGHSNGGQVILHAAARSPNAPAGIVLSNPSLRLAIKVPRHKLWAGQILRRVAPTFTMSASLPHTMMTLDLAHQAQRRVDTLRHDRTNAALFFGMVEGGRRLVAGPSAVRCPTLILLGEADPIVDPTATRAFFDHLGAADRTLLAYPSMLHEPFNDPDRARVFDDVAHWLGERLEAASLPAHLRSQPK